MDSSPVLQRSGNCRLPGRFFSLGNEPVAQTWQVDLAIEMGFLYQRFFVGSFCTSLAIARLTLTAVTTLPTSIIAETKYKGLLSQKKLQIILAEDHHGSA